MTGDRSRKNLVDAGNFALEQIVQSCLDLMEGVDLYLGRLQDNAPASEIGQRCRSASVADIDQLCQCLAMFVCQFQTAPPVLTVSTALSTCSPWKGFEIMPLAPAAWASLFVEA